MRLTDEQVARLRSLEDEHGRLTPERVVEDAKDKRSPLHGLFEWDKAKAAYAFLLHQAREVIGAVRVVITTQTHTVKASAYVRDPEADGRDQGYVNVSTLRQRPEQARESLVYTLEVAAGHLRRAYELASAVGMEAEIDHLLAQVMGVQRQIKEAA